jgi:hypothetical protein
MERIAEAAIRLLLKGKPLPTPYNQIPAKPNRGFEDLSPKKTNPKRYRFPTNDPRFINPRAVAIKKAKKRRNYG